VKGGEKIQKFHKINIVGWPQVKCSPHMQSFFFTFAVPQKELWAFIS